MYYKIELPERKITTITAAIVATEMLSNIYSGYVELHLKDINAFKSHKIKLPLYSCLVVQNEMYGTTLKKALPLLMAENIKIIIFIPVLSVSGNYTYQQKRIQQLNDFIFSDEFKKIFCYTQLNSMEHTTIN